MAKQVCDKAITLEPLEDRVLVLADEAESETRGGILIPDTAKGKPCWGTVVKAGPGKMTEHGILLPMTVKVGDRVLFGKFAGVEVDVDGKKYKMMHVGAEIMAVKK
jgi:chaperonin GroES